MFISSIAAVLHRLLSIQAENWWVTQDWDGWHVNIDHAGRVTTAGPFLNRAEAMAHGQGVYGAASYLAKQ